VMTLGGLVSHWNGGKASDMKKSRRRCTPEKRRRLVAVLDRSERDVLRRSEGAGGVPESIRPPLQSLLRNLPRLLAPPPTRLRSDARRTREW
jgi:hypothetical protein